MCSFASGQDHPLSMTLGKNAEVVLQKAQKSAASEGATLLAAGTVLHLMTFFWGPWGESFRMTNDQGSRGEWSYGSSHSLFFVAKSGEAMSYDGEFPNHMMAIKTGSFPPFYIIGDFAGGNRNANLISIESADSRLDS